MQAFVSHHLFGETYSAVPKSGETFLSRLLNSLRHDLSSYSDREQLCWRSFRKYAQHIPVNKELRTGWAPANFRLGHPATHVCIDNSLLPI